MTRDDAISRTAALNTLDTMDKALDENRTIEEYKELLKECYKQLPPVRVTEKVGRWIPVSERLPERDVSVLTYHRNVSFDYQYVSWIDDYSGEWAGFIGNLSDEVLAWMPLPTPYEPQESEG